MRGSETIAVRAATGVMALVVGLGVGAWSMGGLALAQQAAPTATGPQPASIFPVTGKPLPGPLPPPAHQPHRHGPAVQPPGAAAHAPATVSTPGPSSPPPPMHKSAAVPMTRTTGGQFGGGTQNPCNTPAGAGLGDCTPGGGAHPAPGQAPTQAPDGTPAQNACARSLAAGRDSCANAPANAPGLGLPPDEAPSGG
ncbi:MAG TPA: hypothetical protein VGM79_06375 [Streptosporangiaceae bacterium]